MKITIVTLFPLMFEGILSNSIIKRALGKKVVDINFVDIRDFGISKHKAVDDTPYGGGAGMILRVDVLRNALDSAKCKIKCKEKAILLDAQGEIYTQKKARDCIKEDHLILLCGHYEGVDERIRKFVDQEISIGDYVLTGGEIPAMVVVDSVVRLIPGVLKKHEATQDESFSDYTLASPERNRKTKRYMLLEYPQYTRPEIFEDEKVPGILLSGNHKEIEKWRKTESLKKTKKKRPDLLK